LVTINSLSLSDTLICDISILRWLYISRDDVRGGHVKSIEGVSTGAGLLMNSNVESYAKTIPVDLYNGN